MIRARFAPSPTGFLHIGGARTCLFSWLYARANRGEFVLRIEDTDRARSKKEYLDEILESLKWLGLDWDEIFYQSERFELYRQYAQKLVKENKAYEKEGAVFFKYNLDEIKIDDLIRGEIIFKELPKLEEVIIKSDLSPTYNFSCVIDDALMNITHVIRGEDHISNTPKQILMYEALGFKIPAFAHLPLILSEEGGRMSKRFGATSIREYKEAGYSPDALVNYLLLLGWSPGKNQEIVSLQEAKNNFNIKEVNKTAAAFSLDKLNWVSSSYLKQKTNEQLYAQAEDILKKAGLIEENIDKEYILKIIGLFKDRISKLSDLVDWAQFCFKQDIDYSEDAQKILEINLSAQTNKLIEVLSGLGSFAQADIEQSFRKVCADLGLKAKDLVHPVRIALTGQRIGPGLFETMEVLGKVRVIDRLKKLVQYWNR